MFAWTLGAGAELRLLEPHDATELFLLCEANRERLREFLPWVDNTHSSDDVGRFIAQTLRQFAAGDGFHAAIFQDGTLAGCVGLHPVDWANRSVSLGYWLGAAFEGRGLVTRAAGAVTGYCFERLGLHRVEIRCATLNARSCAVAGRLRFRHEGVLRGAQWVNGRFVDLNVYGRLRTEHAAGEVA